MADARMKILIVDDNFYMRKILKRLLLQLGYINIHEAEDGDTAWAKLKKENFDLILADWNMPKMNGLDLLKNIRASENCKNTPFVMITAKANKNSIVAAIQAGADDYIVKPFKADALEEKINKIFGHLKKHS